MRRPGLPGVVALKAAACRRNALACWGRWTLPRRPWLALTRVGSGGACFCCRSGLGGVEQASKYCYRCNFAEGGGGSQAPGRAWVICHSGMSSSAPGAPPPTHHPPHHHHPAPPPPRSSLKSLLGGASPAACGLVLTEPYLNLPALREAAVRMALTELGFASVYLSTPAPLSMRAHAARHPELPASQAGCGLVVDAGFSFTHAVREGAGGAGTRAAKGQDSGRCSRVGKAGLALGWQVMGHTIIMQTLGLGRGLIEPPLCMPAAADLSEQPSPPRPPPRCPCLTGGCWRLRCGASTWAARRSPTS